MANKDLEQIRDKIMSGFAKLKGTRRKMRTYQITFKKMMQYDYIDSLPLLRQITVVCFGGTAEEAIATIRRNLKLEVEWEVKGIEETP